MQSRSIPWRKEKTRGSRKRCLRCECRFLDHTSEINPRHHRKRLYHLPMAGSGNSETVFVVYIRIFNLRRRRRLAAVRKIATTSFHPTLRPRRGGEPEAKNDDY